MRALLVVVVAVLAGCGREWVKPENVAAELARQEALVAERLAAEADPKARLYLQTAEGALRAARRAQAEGREDRAQQELQVAIDLQAAAGVRR